MFCSNCAVSMSEKATACPGCGHPNPNAQGTKNKVAFVLLALFLGGLGFHRFYLGDIWLGVLGLLFCWTGIPALIAIVEAIVIGFRKNDTRFE